MPAVIFLKFPLNHMNLLILCGLAVKDLPALRHMILIPDGPHALIRHIFPDKTAGILLF